MTLKFKTRKKEKGKKAIAHQQFDSFVWETNKQNHHYQQQQKNKTKQNMGFPAFRHWTQKF